MKRLTNNQKKYLRTLAHNLSPVVIIGQQGLSEAVLSELDSTMKKHELLKIKIRVDDRNKKKETVDKIIKFSKAFLVQIIGNVLVIYRPFEENPMIILPRK
jgi:RNA-binding protein